MFSEYFLKVKHQQFKELEWSYQTKYNMKYWSGEKETPKQPKPENNVFQLGYLHKSLFLPLFQLGLKECCLFKTLQLQSGQLGHN